MSNLQTHYPASKIRVVQKADAVFCWGEGEGKQDEKKLSLSPKYFSDQKNTSVTSLNQQSLSTAYNVHLRHSASQEQHRAQTFCEWLYFSTTFPHPRRIIKACIWRVVLALFQFSLPLSLRISSFILGTQHHSILEPHLSWHGQHFRLNCTGSCAKRCVEDKDNSFHVLLLEYLLVLDGT